MQLHTIISGGQTGADQAGLFAARALGLQTGGMGTKGYRVDGGVDPELLKSFGLQESVSSEYPPRTFANVQRSDGTVIFGNTNSPGTKLTKRYAREIERTWIANPTSKALAAWIVSNGLTVMNVAGNRERTNKGIGKHVRFVIMRAVLMARKMTEPESYGGRRYTASAVFNR